MSRRQQCTGRKKGRRSCDNLSKGTAGGKERGTNKGGNEAETGHEVIVLGEDRVHRKCSCKDVANGAGRLGIIHPVAAEWAWR